MTPRRLATVVAVVAVVAAFLAVLAVGWLARPVRYEIEGLSMAPGLMPGDVVTSGLFAIAERPHRLERWIVGTPDGAVAVKRLVGLPGETVSIADGDLVINGRVCLKSPRVLAEVAVEVTRSIGPRDRPHACFAAGEVLDDVDFATEVNRPLLPVRDAGIAVIVRTAAGGARIHIRVGDTRITWRLPAHGRGCFVAGRLDGHLVATGWRLHDTQAVEEHGCLPAAAPDAWTHAEPWPTPDAAATDAPAMAVDVDETAAVVERLTLWRDILHRPAADGRQEWRLDRDEYFVLGDFPTASRDSRHWGPLHGKALRHRATRHRAGDRRHDPLP